MLKQIIVIFVLIFMNLSICSAAENETGLTLDQCITAALYNNSSLQALFEDEKIDQADYKTSIAELYPTVSFGISTVEYDDDSGETVLVGTGTHYGLSASFSAGYTIYSPGRGNRVFNAKKLVELGKVESFQDYNSIISEVKTAFFALLEADIDLELKKSTLDNYSILYRRLQIEAKAGQVGPLELSNMDVTLANAQLAYDMAEHDQQNAQATLFNLMGVKENDLKVEASEIDRIPQLKVSLEKLNEIGLQSAPSLLIAEYNTEIAKSNVKIAKSQRQPTVSVGVGVGFANTSVAGQGIPITDVPGNLALSGDNWTPSSGLGFSATMPLYTAGRIGANEDKSKALYNKARYETRDAAFDLQNKVKQSYSSLNFLFKQIKITRANVANAKTNLRIVQRSYENGLSTLQALLDASENLYAAQMKHFDRKKEYLITLIELTNLLGVKEDVICE